MKKLLILSCCVMAFISCNKKEEKISGIHPENFNNEVKPAEDFYEYACGGWMKNHPLKPEYARYGTFDQLRENNQIRINVLIKDLGKGKPSAGSLEEKIFTLYQLGMDSVKLNKEKFAPIQSELEAIGKISNRTDLLKKVAEMHRKGGNPFFFTFGESDFTNSARQITWVYQDGLGMGERDYYLKPEKNEAEIRSHYREYLIKLMTSSDAAKLLGVKLTPEQLADAVLKTETALAKASIDKETLRDPQLNFNKMKLADFQKKTPEIDFTTYFEILGLKNVDSINIAQPTYMKEVGTLMNTANLDELKAYLAWNTINDAASYLDDETKAAQFHFYDKVMKGKEEMEARWKTVSSNVDNSFGEALGKLYVAKYFPAEAKANMINLVKNLQVSLGERIDKLEWMSAETKANAHKKINTFRVKIGYPDKWRDYSNLSIQSDSYYANILRSREFEKAYSLSKISKPTDPDEWGMTPQTVNAYYNPSTNEICFPAAILQPPFYDMNADDAVNYGAIGVVIGHEMTHGFDDQGSKYDQDGNLKNWWTEADNTNFNKRTKVLVDYFNQIEVTPGVKANGSFTLGENIADNGGLQISYQAMQKALAEKKIQPTMDNFSAAQRFYIAYAMLWAGNVREKEIIRLTNIDVHSLGRWRVNATLKHITPFIDSFNVKEGDGMYLSPDKRVSIW